MKCVLGKHWPIVKSGRSWLGSKPTLFFFLGIRARQKRDKKAEAGEVCAIFRGGFRCRTEHGEEFCLIGRGVAFGWLGVAFGG